MYKGIDQLEVDLQSAKRFDSKAFVVAAIVVFGLINKSGSSRFAFNLQDKLKMKKLGSSTNAR